MKSSDAGPTDIPILEETIGENFERTVAANPDGDALVDMASGRRWTYAELNDEIDVVARGLMALGIERGERVGMWAPNCPEWTIVQYATAKIGAILVNINPAYRTHELAYVLEAVGRPHAGLRDGVQDVGLRRAWSTRSGRTHRTCSEVVFLGTDDWDAPRRRRARRSPSTTCGPGWPHSTTTEPINIQYTSGTTGFPKGATLSHRNILNNGYFTTELINFGPDDRLCIPVPFYHCFGMVMGNLGCTSARRHDGHSRARIRSGAHAGGHRKGKVYSSLRRADDVHRDARRPRPRRPRPVVAAYRHHGRIGLSRRGDEALRQRDEHDRGRHRLRHDRDVTGVMPDAHRRRSRAAHRDDRPRPSPRRDQDRRPRHRRRSSNAVSPGSSARAATR